MLVRGEGEIVIYNESLVGLLLIKVKGHKGVFMRKGMLNLF